MTTQTRAPWPLDNSEGRSARPSASAISRRRLGQRVRLNDRVKPAYQRGELETVHELYGDEIVVLRDRVVGRFSSRHLRCAPEVLDLLEDT